MQRGPGKGNIVETQYKPAANQQQAARRPVPAHVWGVLAAYIDRKHRELAQADPLSPRIKPTVARAFDLSVWR